MNLFKSSHYGPIGEISVRRGYLPGNFLLCDNISKRLSWEIGICSVTKKVPLENCDLFDESRKDVPWKKKNRYFWELSRWLLLFIASVYCQILLKIWKLNEHQQYIRTKHQGFGGIISYLSKQNIISLLVRAVFISLKDKRISMTPLLRAHI